jgi:DNA-binding MarR family transcriptional regulator
VPGKIQQELAQTRPFATLEQEAFVNVQRTAGVLQQRIVELLKPFGLSPTQYNVLRILRGAGESGAACKDIGSRLVTPDPDVTRLIDRLERRGLVTRGRSATDRRRVPVQITAAGLDLLSQLDQPVVASCGTTMAPLNPDELQMLIDLLERLRS